MGKIKNKEDKKDVAISPLFRNKTSKRGFTLMELVVSVFIFSVVMISVTALFSRFVVYQKRARAIQQNMEDARYAMELMAKTLRTSSVLSLDGNFDYIDLYDYSQGKCIKYSLASSKINLESAGPAGITDKDDCAGATFSAPVPMVGKSINNMTFSVTTSGSGVVGKVTISMVICSKDSSCSGTENDRANLQTTVSLRDYVESNP